MAAQYTDAFCDASTSAGTAEPVAVQAKALSEACLAARAGHADTVSVLLDFEADVTAADAEGVRALDLSLIHI